MVYPLTRKYPRYLEFQEQVWKDIVRSSPTYILLVTNIPTSIVWDGQAKLDILNRLDALIKSHYKVIAVMPVRKPRRHLELVKDGQLPADSADDQPNIYVCQKIT